MASVDEELDADDVISGVLFLRAVERVAEEEMGADEPGIALGTDAASEDALV